MEFMDAIIDTLRAYRQIDNNEISILGEGAAAAQAEQLAEWRSWHTEQELELAVL